MVTTVHAIKGSLWFLNQKSSQKPVPDLLKFEHDQKIYFHYYHLQLEYYPLYENKAKVLNDESMILKTENYNFEEGPAFVTKEIHYHLECKRNYLHKKKDKSSNIKGSALERCLSYVRNKIIKIVAEDKTKLASFLLDLYNQYYAAESGNENDLPACNVQNMCRMLQLRISLNIEAKSSKTVCSYHVTYAFQSESALYSWLPQSLKIQILHLLWARSSLTFRQL